MSMCVYVCLKEDRKRDYIVEYLHSFVRVCVCACVRDTSAFRISVHRVQKLLPLDLRPKKTRAIRRALTPAQKAMVTVKEAKRKQNFPKRKYAIKA